MSPVKIAAAVAVCALLFWLGLRITRVMVDLGIRAGHAEERRRDEARRRDEERLRDEERHLTEERLRDEADR